MLDHLLKMISIESLILSYKEQNLFHDFNVHHETYALRKAKVSKISDSDILKSILPHDVSNKMFSSGHLNLLAFIFALRHKILEVNALFHLSAIKHKNSTLFDETKDDFCLIFGNDFYDNYNQLFKILIPQFWGKSKELPIFGFSAVGCHFAMRDIDYCRAFDAYHLPYCNHKTNGIFCERHMQEKFWFNEMPETASVQAKLSQFYVDPKNFAQFDEDSLKKLVQDFFNYFGRFEKEKAFLQVDSKKVNFLLEFYSFSSVEELKKEGEVELRRRFIELAKQYHPDTGGSHELFREARENYEYLREMFVR